MDQRLLRSRRLIEYALVSAGFWASLWIFWGGTGESGSTSVHLGWQGAALNGLLLLPLFLGFGWARWILVVEAFASVVFIASLGVPPFGPTFGIMAFVALLQIALLLSAGSARRPTVRSRFQGHSAVD